MGNLWKSSEEIYRTSQHLRYMERIQIHLLWVFDGFKKIFLFSIAKLLSGREYHNHTNVSDIQSVERFFSHFISKSCITFETDLHTPKTNMTMKKSNLYLKMYIYPMKHGDFPVCHLVLVLGLSNKKRTEVFFVIWSSRCFFTLFNSNQLHLWRVWSICNLIQLKVWSAHQNARLMTYKEGGWKVSRGVPMPPKEIKEAT